MLADWGPSVRAQWRVLADTEVTPDLMATHDLVLVGTAATNGVLAGLVGLPIRQDASGTFVEDRKVAGPGATYRLHRTRTPGRRAGSSSSTAAAARRR